MKPAKKRAAKFETCHSDPAKAGEESLSSPTETLASLLAAVSSPDLNAERLAALKQLFPDLFTNEGRLNLDELKKVVDPALVSETERYDFRWYGKTKSKRDAFTPSRAALVYDPARSVNPDKANGNMIIEGENLEVLKLLSSAYRERIKCIYIDPPYNTGKDFVYSDRFAEGQKPYWEQTGVTEAGVKVDTNTESQGRFHSNWLSMLHSRLLTARYLLQPDGVIFVSIDDRELNNLRRLMNEVFGEENFITQFVWEKKKKPSFLDKNVGSICEYILCYVRDESRSFPFSVDTTTAGKKYPFNNAGNAEAVLTFSAGSVQFLMADCTVSAQDMSGGNIKTELIEDVVIKDGRNLEAFRLRGEFRYSQEKLNEVVAAGDSITISKVPFRPNHVKAGGEPKKMKNLLSVAHYAIATYEDASAEILSIFGVEVFEYSKPSKLLGLLVAAVTYDNDSPIILDFFAGSGTTAQAVMDLNKTDGGNRKFILVQLPELTAEDSPAFKAGYKRISDITIERVKRVVQKFTKEAEGLLPNEPQRQFADTLGFKVYTLAKSAFPRVEFAPDPAKTEAENIELLKQYICEKEATFHIQFEKDKVLDEVLLKNGFMLDYTLTRQPQFAKNEVFLAKDAFKESLICLDAKIKPETVDHFKTHKDQFFICLELALDTTRKWNLRHNLGEKLKSI